MASVNGIFKRGLSDDFVSALQVEALKGGWWRDVLADRTLLIAVRNECLNVYWRGQSLFEIKFARGACSARTHPKYLLDPSLADLVQFDGQKFEIGKLESTALLRRYEGGSTLEKMKKAAGVYANGEKIGVHAIATNNLSVVDVEIALSNAGDEELGKLPRLDIAALERGGAGDVYLVFWEAKLYSSKELRAVDGDASVLRQIAKYRAMISAHRDALRSSYSRVARNLTAIAEMSEGVRLVSPFVREVATGGSKLRIREPADIGLTVFGFDQAQGDDERWKLRLDALRKAGPLRIKAAGSPKSIAL